MTISFDAIPSTLRVPVCSVEFNSSRAQQGSALLAYKGLLIGQKTSGGTAAANSVHRVTSADDVLTLAGRGSMLHRMAIAWFANNSYTECWIGVLDDASGGVAATKLITITGTATADGTISLYVDGKLISIPVTAAGVNTPTEIAAAIAVALNLELDLPLGTATAAAEVVTVPFKHKGVVGQDLDIRVNYQSGETLPTGVTSVVVTAGVAGTTNPTLTTLLAALGDSWYNILANPYTDATSLTAIETELTSRWGPMRMIDGVAFASAAGSYGTLAALGETRNSKHSAIIAQPGESPLTLPCEFAAAVAAVVAYYGNIDPARPFTTLPLAGVLAPAEADLFTWQERDLLLHDGIATTRVEAGGIVQLERPITTYQTSAAGADDTAYLDVTTLLSLMYVRYSWRARVLLKFPRHKLADDGTRFGAGQAVVTPKVMKAEALAWFRELEELAIVENFDAFKAALVIERNATDPNRLDMLLPPDLVNQLLVAATQVQFLL